MICLQFKQYFNDEEDVELEVDLYRHFRIPMSYCLYNDNIVF